MIDSAAAATEDAGRETAVELRSVSKSFGSTQVLKDITLRAGAGEFVTLLGPSGCGKTTSLRIIAGFEVPGSGDVVLNGVSMLSLPPWRRDIGVVFQSYALFPYLSALDNVAFGLRMRRVPKADLRRRVEAALDLVGLSDLGDRFPRHLSGGQRQRVALARALVIAPRLLLLDEPLSNLDAKLRQEMRLEIKRIQRDSGVTTIFVTHDQEEAFSLSDRIVLMSGGRIAQDAAPRDLWERPASAFVADFIGVQNLVPARIVVRGGQTCAMVSDRLCLPLPDAGIDDGAEICLGFRASSLRLATGPRPEGDGTAFTARVVDADYRGETCTYRLACEMFDRPLVAEAPSSQKFGDTVSVSVDQMGLMALTDDR